jgi:hypothetical protein
MERMENQDGLGPMECRAQWEGRDKKAKKEDLGNKERQGKQVRVKYVN